MVVDTEQLRTDECRVRMPAEACTELGADTHRGEPPVRVAEVRRLLGICTASWLVPVCVLAIAVAIARCGIQ